MHVAGTICLLIVGFQAPPDSGNDETLTPVEAWNRATAEWIFQMERGELLLPEQPKFSPLFRNLFASKKPQKIEVSAEQDGKRTVFQEIYYQPGEFHVTHPGSTGGLSFIDGKFRRWSNTEDGEYLQGGYDEAIQYLWYLTDPGGLMFGTYGNYERAPQYFDTATLNKGNIIVISPKPDTDNPILSLKVSKDPLWFMEVKWNTDDAPVSRIYSQPKVIEKIPDEIANRWKSVTYNKTGRHIHSYMIYP